MKAQARSLGLVFAAFVVLLAISAAALRLLGPATDSCEPENRVSIQPLAGSSSIPPSGGISSTWQSGVLKSIRESEYQVLRQESTGLPDVTAAWQAPNRAHNFRTWFTAGGPRVVPRTARDSEWAWGMTLRGWGYRGNTQPVSKATLSASGNRVEYQREGLTEWYVNDEKGIEQGFTLAAPPEREQKGRPIGAPASDSSWIELELGLTGNLKAVLDSSGTAIEMATSSGVRVVRYGMLEAFDATGRRLPSRLELNGSQIALLVDTREALYPVVVDPLATSPAWTAESDQADARFGYSVATAGDVNGDGYSDVIVGAPYYDNGQTDEGRAFLYFGSAGGLAALPAWTAESDQAWARFGDSVATAGDVNGDGYSDVIVGAFYYNNGQADEGRAFLYLGSAGGLGALPAWTAESDQTYSEFGRSVATAGDVNGDGYSDVIVGAPFYDNGQGDEGCAFLYLGSAGGLGALPAWSAESDQDYASFGTSVATAGDVNGDGYSDVIVGAYGYDNGQTSEGRAFLYLGSAGGLGALPAWTAESDQAFAFFGCSVATAGDVNGDGYSDVMVGAYGYDNGQADEGRAFLYPGSADGLGAVPAWTAETDQAGAAFGRSVATAGDMNGDGYSDVIVGAPSYANGQAGEGGAFLYLGSAGGLGALPAWTDESDQANAWFGVSVAAAGDVNGDGYSDVIVGAPSYDNGQGPEGRAFLYLGSADGLGALPAWGAESDQAYAEFGSSVAAAGDVNGDGYSDVIVGAPYYDHGQEDEGRAFLYLGSASGLSSLPAWTAESDQAGAGFGFSAATAGDVNGDGYSDVIVGAPYHDKGQANEGGAFLYLGSAGGLGALPAWAAESDQASARFGNSVATAGDVNGDGYSDVIVGALWYDKGQADEGRAFLYLGSAGGLGALPAWTAESDQAGANFGWSVATAGDVNGDGYSDVIVGAHGYHDGQLNEGRAFLYLGSAGGLGALPAWTAESDQANAYFGWSVATAGDVNGDGYSDVIMGASGYDNGQANEGRAYLYLGSAGGLSALPAWTAESDQAHAYFGYSVATAGDVNGDGYSDVIGGAPYHDNGQANEGGAFLYYGNGGAGISLNARQRLLDDAAPVDRLGLSRSTSSFRVSSRGPSPYGRGKVRLQWEVKPLGIPFDGANTGQSASWSDTGTGGASLSEEVSSLTANTLYHWRLRLLYHPATTPFQPFSRWISPFGNGWQEADVRVGVPPPPIDVFFPAPDTSLFQLRTDRQANVAVVSPVPGGGLSSHSPAIAVFQDRQFIAVKNAGNSAIYIKSRARGGSFAESDWTQVPGGTSSSPALCTFNDRLYLFVKGAGGPGLFYRSMDTAGEWSSWSSVSGSNTLWHPGLVVFGGRLFCFVADANSTQPNLWYKSMDTAGTWSDWSNIPTGSTNAALTPVAQGGKIWLFVKGLGGKLLWWSSTTTPETPSSWTSPWASCSGSSEAAPGVLLEPEENLFHLVVRGNMVPRIWHRTFDPGTLAWGDWHLLTNLDPAAQSIDAPTVVPTNW